MKKLLLSLIRFYRPFHLTSVSPSCRFVPTCSQYALEAIEKYGAGQRRMAGLEALSAVPSFPQGRLV